MKKLFPGLLLLCVSVFSFPVSQAQTNALFVRVIDVGAGLCCVVKTPDDHYMIYDAGVGSGTIKRIEKLIKTNVIDLLVLSHNDSDHIGSVSNICKSFTVKTALHTGMYRATDAFANAKKSILKEVQTENCRNLDLGKTNISPGRTFQVGSVPVTFVCGFNKPLKSWGLKNAGEKNNAVSIVMRLEYAGKSILFCGDAVGRHKDDPDENACIATEKFIVDRTNALPVRSDIIIAPHHGADNGSSKAFVQAVSPTYVIFSAGSKHHHPTDAAARRYLTNGVALTNFFRTDLGDDEDGTGDEEWDQGRIPGHNDESGDDNIDILVTSNGEITIQYRDDP
jgi:competence protein ComEC